MLGAMMVVAAVMSLRDRSNPKRYSTALFWALYAVAYLGGDYLACQAVAYLIMVSMALIIKLRRRLAGQLRHLVERRAQCQRASWGTACSSRR
ncbi:DUF979 domain-containing protein [Massilia sp. H-1]|nr:DUF979 domain-containing protein [Massilia sp. H-1]